MPRQIALLVYPDFQLLDAAGPLSAFEAANEFQPGSYALTVIAREAGAVRSSGGARLMARAFTEVAEIDTLMIAGGNGIEQASCCGATRDFVGAAAPHLRRIASVCSGAYLLATTGLLAGRRATTHWQRSRDFAQRFPEVRLEADRIFTQDGKVWTSAGISAGIDLALALIGEDLGEALARQVAHQLVVYYRRPGGQSQFSTMAALQPPAGPFVALLDHIRSHLQERLDVDQLAAQCCMSPRHFARRFTQEVGMTPARAVERLRVEAAAAALESGRPAVQEVARRYGFGDGERMRRAFVRTLGVPPSARWRSGP